jgi:predicted amidophosphoribosyltransferase
LSPGTFGATAADWVEWDRARTEHRCVCVGCKASYPTRYTACPTCRIPLELVEVRRVSFTQDQPVGRAE